MYADRDRDRGDPDALVWAAGQKHGCTMFPVPALAQKLLDHIRHTDLLKPGDRVGVAVSGGADSTALLRLLLELRPALGVVL